MDSELLKTESLFQRHLAAGSSLLCALTDATDFFAVSGTNNGTWFMRGQREIC